MASETTLNDYALELLTACEAALATTIGGIPDRSFVTVALPALDCPEQLTVHVQSLAIDTRPDPNSGEIKLKIGYRNLVTFAATIVRCTPQPNGLAPAMPDPADLEALAEKTQQDLWAIWNHLAKLVKDEVIFEGCGVTAFNVAQPQLESGTSAGWVFSLTTQIAAYEVV